MIESIEKMENQEVLNYTPIEEIIKQEYNGFVSSHNDQTETNRKIEKIEALTESSEIPEVSDDLTIKNEELWIKEEEPNSIHSSYQEALLEMEKSETMVNKSIEEIIKQEYNGFVSSHSDQTNANMKIEIIEALTEISEIPEVSDDLTIKNEELSIIKEEEPNSNQISFSQTDLNQEKLEDTDGRFTTGKKNDKEDLLLDFLIEEPIYKQSDLNIKLVCGNNFEIYKCDECHFETRYKTSIVFHLQRHKEKKWVKLKCNECDWETFHKDHLEHHKLQRHVLHPKRIEEVEMFKCYECDFQSKNKSRLRSHIPNHKKKKLFFHKCTKCDYQTNKGFDIRIHLLSHEENHKLLHQDPENKKKFKCDQCDFQSFESSELQRHLLLHKSINKVKMLKCDECRFQTKYQLSLKWHIERCHKKNQLVCTKCDYKTNKAYDIRIHLLSHEENHKLLHQDPESILCEKTGIFYTNHL